MASWGRVTDPKQSFLHLTIPTLKTDGDCAFMIAALQLHLGFGENYQQSIYLACEQPLRGAIAAGWEKDGDLGTTSLEFEYLHRKSRCEMLIGEDDISNDVITLGACFSVFVYIRARFRRLAD